MKTQRTKKLMIFTPGRFSAAPDRQNAEDRNVSEVLTGRMQKIATGNPDSWFQIVNFKGAFGESNWIEGWTLLAE